jgi:hypothetical protein
MKSTVLSLTLLLLCTTPTFTYSLELSSSSWFPWRRSWRRATSSATNVPPAGYYNPLDSGGSLLTVRRPLGQRILGMTDFLFSANTCNISNGSRGTSQRHHFWELWCARHGGRRGEWGFEKLLFVRSFLLSVPLVRVLSNCSIPLAFIFVRSFGFSAECLGQHAGSDQGANLGDGNGYCEQLFCQHIGWNLWADTLALLPSERNFCNTVELWRCAAWVLQGDGSRWQSLSVLGAEWGTEE